MDCKCSGIYSSSYFKKILENRSLKRKKTLEELKYFRGILVYHSVYISLVLSYIVLSYKANI